MKDTILFGDCRETLKQFDEKARVCVTSPPYYGLRDYGGENNQIGQEQTPEEYVDEMVKVFRLVRDCLTDDGTLWLNIGDSYYNYRNRIIDICCRMISTDGKVTLNERIWLNKLIENNKSAKMIVDSMVDFNNYDSIHC